MSAFDQSGFHKILSEYYRKRAKEAEDCLGDILKILGNGSSDDENQIARIIHRLIEHYSPQHPSHSRQDAND